MYEKIINDQEMVKLYQDISELGRIIILNW